MTSEGSKEKKNRSVDSVTYYVSIYVNNITTSILNPTKTAERAINVL